MVPDDPHPLCSEGEIQAQKSHLCKLAQLIGSLPIGQIQRDACYIPLFWAGSIGVEGERSLDCWAEKKHLQADGVPRVLPERARGLVTGGRARTKSKRNPFIMVTGPILTQLHLRAVEEIGALGSWEALQDPKLEKELSPHPQTTTWVCSALGQELVGRI